MSERSRDQYPQGEEWKADALCAGADINVFFPNDSRRAEYRESLREIASFCVPCPVREECGRYAWRAGIRHGIWGGLSVQGRERLAELGEL